MGGRKESDPTTIRARELRRGQTNAERLLWWKLRGRHKNSLKFRRQHPVPPYIVDFAERSFKLAVEVDGATHGSAGELAYDAQRTAFLEGRGWHVICVGNQAVYDDLDSVLSYILKTAYGLRTAASKPPIDPGADAPGPLPPVSGEKDSHD